MRQYVIQNLKILGYNISIMQNEEGHTWPHFDQPIPSQEKINSIEKYLSNEGWLDSPPKIIHNNNFTQPKITIHYKNGSKESYQTEGVGFISIDQKSGKAIIQFHGKFFELDQINHISGLKSTQ